ncbi:MAG: aminotransferase class IV family protein [Gammaproteobacteria bacterium]|nr:aminotransferase class IV family protein [Gammaproteobacteria bacterium]
MAKVFLNGKIVDDDKAHISISDSGFLYGMGLFETMRAAGGKVFALDDHLDRLFASIAALGLKNVSDREYIVKAIDKTLKANKLKDARLRLTLTNGPVAAESENPTLLVTATDFQPYPPEYYKDGVRAVITDCRQNATEPTAGHKTTDLFSRLHVLNEAHKKKAAEALWFTTENILAEGCVSNVFLVKDGILQTPRLETPILPGITRKTILRIAPNEQLEVVEKDLTIQDVLAADEIFLTNVVMLVLPVIQVEARAIGDGKPGEITKKILAALQNEVSAHGEKK